MLALVGLRGRGYKGLRSLAVTFQKRLKRFDFLIVWEECVLQDPKVSESIFINVYLKKNLKFKKSLHYMCVGSSLFGMLPQIFMLFNCDGSPYIFYKLVVGLGMIGRGEYNSYLADKHRQNQGELLSKQGRI